jgi:hypothetical protein
VCFAFGQYLANGHGAFTGLKNRANILWIEGGDTLPPNGSEGALRALKILEGLQAAGDTHLQASHWQHDYLPSDQTDFAPHLDANTVYSHGPYPTPGPTYMVSRLLYASTPARPAWLIETNYWGEHGATRAQLRYFSWGSALSAIGGTTFGFSPFWGFATSADGSTGTPSGGSSTESPRLSRRLPLLRGWSHDQANEVFPRGARACGSDGAGTSARTRIAMVGDRIDRRQDRLYGADAVQLGSPGRA